VIAIVVSINFKSDFFILYGTIIYNIHTRTMEYVYVKENPLLNALSMVRDIKVEPKVEPPNKKSKKGKK